MVKNDLNDSSTNCRGDPVVRDRNVSNTSCFCVEREETSDFDEDISESRETV